MRDTLNTPILPVAKSIPAIDISAYQKNPKAIPIIFIGGYCISPLSETDQSVKVDIVSIDAPDQQQYWSDFMENAPCEITPALAALCGHTMVNVSVNSSRKIELIYIVGKSATTDSYHININVASGVCVEIDQYVHAIESEAQSACIVSRTVELAKNARCDDQFVGHMPPISFMQCQKVSCDENSEYNNYQALAGGKICRQVTEVTLAAPHAKAAVHAVGLANEKQRHDHTILMRHHAPHTQSTQQVKYCVDQSGLSNFSSRVYVEPGIGDVESEQLNHNLLLSNQARALTAPELEIYADDVRCAHGATVGALDEQAIFYLQSRGLSEKQARAILVSGFMKDLIETFPPSVCQRAQSLIDCLLQQTDAG